MKTFYDIIDSIMVSVITITVVILFLFRAVSVDGISMEPTLKHNERLIVTNFFYNPEKGDIVVIDKNNSYNKPLVKRVIATEGDIIKIDYSTGDVYVNNQLLVENYINEKIYPENVPNLEVTVSKGCVFVMGDNRNHSADSRVKEIGLINNKNILGRVILRIYPFNNIGVL